ncbi:N-acetylmuramic acid 6-phosphate etherase [Roseobacter sp. SK209-2-6]|uniref:N-acetylmuramic acid 6-phosphate etherase n=1 Tax=Roseobacter sp. SK209-2-6 TaxID=388739 RepID=UPI0002DCE254
MTGVNTEKLHASVAGLDLRPQLEAARLLVVSQGEAAQSALSALPQICAAATVMAAAIGGGGRLFYTAAGSSGLMAAADAMELGGTFGIPADQIRILMAGGVPQNAEMPGDTEDDIASLQGELLDLGPADCLIAVSASGSTPYTLEAARIARNAKCPVVALANNPGAALLQESDFPVLLPTPPEVLSGSTRLGAGTAQKIALNSLSTLMALELGHIHDGMMVNLRADNAKLRQRAKSIVSTIAEVSADQAEVAIQNAQGDVKIAILLAAGVQDYAAAKNELTQSRGHLRPVLDRLRDLHST